MILLPYYSWIMQYPPAVPKLYFGAISAEQRIKEICCKIEGLERYMEYLSKQAIEFEDHIQAELLRIVEETMAALDEAMAEILRTTGDELQALRDWVEQQTYAAEVWDVTTGSRQAGVDAMRRLFADVTVDGATVDELAASENVTTVSALSDSGWNVRALAVIGAQVLGETYPEQWHILI